MTVPVFFSEAPEVQGPRQGQWTYADWEALPDDEYIYEVVDGVLYMTTAPSSFHQWIIKRFERYIGIPAEDQGLAYAYPSPIGVLMLGCDPVQPDYVVILAQNVAIIDRRIQGVPDVLIEVQSPSNVAQDEVIKLAAYARAGVPEYVIVKPRLRTLEHYRLQAGRYGAPHTFGSGDVFTLDCLPTLQVPVGELFAGAPNTTL